MRKRTPGFVACTEINRKARNAVSIDIIDLIVIFEINVQLSEALRTEIENQMVTLSGLTFLGSKPIIFARYRK